MLIALLFACEPSVCVTVQAGDDAVFVVVEDEIAEIVGPDSFAEVCVAEGERVTLAIAEPLP